MMDSNYAGARHQETPILSMASPALIDTDDLSCSDCPRVLQEMLLALRDSWNKEQKVKALKIVIQMCKLLTDTRQLRVYTKKHRLVTDALDEFGDMIYKRIESKIYKPLHSNYNDNAYPPAASTGGAFLNSHDNLVDIAKEICKNWFFKIASIRELAPRFYIELAILKICAISLPTNSKHVLVAKQLFFFENLNRLTKAAWGFGDPLVALYARVQICKMAVKLLNQQHETQDSNETIFNVILLNLKNSLTLIGRSDLRIVLQTLINQNVDPIVYFDLISNALQSIINLVTQYKNSYTEDDKLSPAAKEKIEIMFNCILEQVRHRECSFFGQNIIIHSALRSFPFDVTAEHVLELLETFQTIHNHWVATKDRDNEVSMIASTLFIPLQSFAIALYGSEAFETNSDYSVKELTFNSADEILDDLFRYNRIIESSYILNYMRSFLAWFSFANQFIEISQVDELLIRFISKIQQDRQYVNYYSSLEDVVKILVENKKSLEKVQELFTLRSFSQLLDLLHEDNRRLEISRWIVETMYANVRLNTRQRSVNITNENMINFLLKVYVAFHNYTSLLVTSYDVEHISESIMYFLDKIPIDTA